MLGWVQTDGAKRVECIGQDEHITVKRGKFGCVKMMWRSILYVKLGRSDGWWEWVMVKEEEVSRRREVKLAPREDDTHLM